MASFIGNIVFIILSIFMIIIGVVLTVTLVFAFIGIPLVIIGAIILMFSVFSLVFGTLGRFLDFFSRPFRKQDKKDDNVIDVEKEDGVYKAKKKSF